MNDSDVHQLKLHCSVLLMARNISMGEFAAAVGATFRVGWLAEEILQTTNCLQEIREVEANLSQLHRTQDGSKKSLYRWMPASYQIPYLYLLFGIGL